MNILTSSSNARPARLVGALAAQALIAATAAASPDSPRPVTSAPGSGALPSTYRVEWVYRVKWGQDDEFWRLFKKTQVPVLDEELKRGYALTYEVLKPGLHTSEDSRWSYRIVIVYRDITASTHGGELERQLFPNQVEYKQDEARRWSLIDAHYDLPIRLVDPHSAD